MRNKKKLLGENKIRVLWVWLQIFALFISLGNFEKDTFYAYEAKSGRIVNGTPYVYTRVEPSDESERVNTLENNKEVTVINETVDANGETWYLVKYFLKANGQERQGYCRSYNVSFKEQIDAETIVEPIEYLANAPVLAIGTINGNNVFVRQSAGLSGTYMFSLYRGNTVDVIGQATVDGAIWYQINCVNNGKNYTGWTHGKYIDLVYTNIETDEAFEQGLRDAGFPESYITNLSALHAKYPNWTFLPVHTGLKWSDVIKAESKAAVNMVQTSQDDAKKSLASSEYNWYTNTWTIRDGSSWVTAHPDYIAYCMDPRNFLTETSIFQYESLSFSSQHTVDGVKAVINDSFMMADALEPDGSMLNYANAFMSIGQTTNVSPYHLASRVLQEQGGGTSKLISGTYSGYEGYFNYFNINAFGTPVDVLYKNGLSYAKSQGWNSRYNSLLGGAQFLSEKYISKGQDSLYFQKFNVVYADKLYYHQYMANVTAAITEGQKIAKAYSDKTQSFVFKIPVYLNMPEQPVTFTRSGNPNNYLAGLSVSGLPLTPNYDAAVTDYSIIVDASIETISVDALPVSSKSKVRGAGTHALVTGTNVIKVDCTSESGQTRTYNIVVEKQAQSDIIYNIASDKYTIGTYVTGVEPGTTVSDFLSNISCTEGVVKVITASGQENTGTIATGNKVAVYINDVLVGTKDIVIYGDVDGDGVIGIVDVMMTNRYTLRLYNLSGAFLEAGDVDRQKDGVGIVDVMMMNRHTLGMYSIQQK